MLNLFPSQNGTVFSCFYVSWQRSWCRWAVPAALLLLGRLTVAAGAADITSTWTGAAGAWAYPGNWKNTPASSRYPNNVADGPSFDVSIPSGGPIYVMSPIAVQNLNSAADLNLLNGATLTVNSGMNLAGKTVNILYQGNATNLVFSGDQTLSGTGQIVFNGADDFGATGALAGTLTIEQGITIRTGSSGGTIGFPWLLTDLPAGGVINRGTISAQTPSNGIASLALSAHPSYNEGVLQAKNSSSLTLSGAWVNRSGGRIQAIDSGVVLMGAPRNQTSWSNEAGGVLSSSNGGTLILGGGGSNNGIIDCSSIVILQPPAAADNAIFEKLVADISNGQDAAPVRWPWPDQGLTSSAAAADQTGMTTIGAVLNRDARGNRIFDGFAGRQLDTSSIVLKYTLAGDANLDGMVNSDDYGLIDSGFISRAGGWYNGDFNYDGMVNADDYGRIDAGFLAQSGLAGARIRQTRAVPEPGAGVVVALAAVAIMRLRRRAL